MNYIDIVLGIIILIAAVIGFRKGFIIEFASLAALVLGIWGGIKFSDLTAGFITRHTGYYSDYLSIIAFFITFIIIVILIHVMAKLLTTIIKAAMLGFLNRLAGVIFGVLKIAVIMSILLLLFDEVDENVHILPVRQKDTSVLYGPMKQVVPTLLPFVKLNTLKNKEPKKENQPEKKDKTKIT